MYVSIDQMTSALKQIKKLKTTKSPTKDDEKLEEGMYVYVFECAKYV
jgi:hypothetical protein